MGARILLIDDEESVLEMLERYFSREGFDVAGALEGAEGLAIHRSSPVAIVVTDILMPHKEGFEIMREFRQEYPEVKIDAISGGGRNDPATYLDFAKAFGADRVFTKPLNLTKLIGAVEELLGSKAVS